MKRKKQTFKNKLFIQRNSYSKKQTFYSKKFLFKKTKNFIQKNTQLIQYFRHGYDGPKRTDDDDDDDESATTTGCPQLPSRTTGRC